MKTTSKKDFGKVFDEIAADYDQYRPNYPDQLVDYACQLANLKEGDKVLELGCGSGQLTKSLVARGLRVVAVEPGEKLIALAKNNLDGYGDVDFVHATFENVRLPRKSFKAVFSAAAFHWIDPEISWRKAADILIPGGTIVLMQHFGLRESRTTKDLNLQLSALARVSPEAAAKWQHYFGLNELVDGIDRRRENLSEAWSWLGSFDLAREYVEELFEAVQVAALPILIEQTADQAISLLRTLSFYSQLTGAQREALGHEYHKIPEILGRPMRSSIVSVLVGAHRS